MLRLCASPLFADRAQLQRGAQCDEAEREFSFVAEGGDIAQFAARPRNSAIKKIIRYGIRPARWPTAPARNRLRPGVGFGDS